MSTANTSRIGLHLRLESHNTLIYSAYTYFPLTVATHTTTTQETESTSSSSNSGRDSCTEPLVMAGCIGFIGGVIATLLVCLPTFLFVCRRKPKIKMTRYNTNYRTNMQNLSISMPLSCLFGLEGMCVFQYQSVGRRSM